MDTRESFDVKEDYRDLKLKYDYKSMYGVKFEYVDDPFSLIRMRNLLPGGVFYNLMMFSIYGPKIQQKQGEIICQQD